MSEMAAPEEHTAKGGLPTPSAFTGASTGAAVFQSWLEEEEEEWRLGRMLEAKCPKEFICPISLDIMADPVILVRSHTVRNVSACMITLFNCKCEERGICQHVRLRSQPAALRMPTLTSESIPLTGRGQRTMASSASRAQTRCCSTWPSDRCLLQVETGMMYDRRNIRKWLLLGGSTCPLTGVKLITRKVRSGALACSAII